MFEYCFYPFKKQLADLNGDDLLLLGNVSEGWYIDYKVSNIKIDDYARHLSAFANQYGGWLIVGISEADDGSKRAGAFPGIEKSDVDKVLLQIREASSTHCHPPVLYEEKVVYGPQEKISLPVGRAIVLIGIPKSMNTPHIHSSGRIYRRLSDQSKPKEETDRYVLDDLWKRGERHREEFSSFVQNHPPLADGNKKARWLYIYLIPEIFSKPPEDLLYFKDFDSCVRNLSRNSGGMFASMDALYRAPDGFIARQVEKNDPSAGCLTFRYWHDGRARFEIPLNHGPLSELPSSLSNYKHLNTYKSIAIERCCNPSATVVDYSLVFPVLAALSNTYVSISKYRGDRREVKASFSIINVAHTLSFVDSKKFIERIENYSLPVCLDETINKPKSANWENLIKLQNKEAEITESELSVHSSTLYLLMVKIGILLSVGIIQEPEDFGTDFDLYSSDKIH